MAKFFLINLLILYMCWTINGESQECGGIGAQKLVHLCTGKYPNALILKYDDKRVDADDQYSIYKWPEDPNHYFMTFKQSSITNCEFLEVKNPQEFLCFAKEGHPIERIIPHGIITCVALKIHLVDELIEACYKQNNIRKSIVPSTFVAFHYPNSHYITTRKSENGIKKHKPIIFLIVLLLFVPAFGRTVLFA